MEEVKKASTLTTLRLGELEVPIALYKTTTDKASRRKFEKADAAGNPLETSTKSTKKTEHEGSLADALTGRESETPPPEPEEVEKPDIRTGVRKEDGDFVDLTAELEEIEERTSLERFEVLSFVRRERIPRDRIIGSYFLAAGDPDGGFPPARVLGLLRKAMVKAERVAVVRWTKRKGHCLGVVIPAASGTIVVLEIALVENARLPNRKCLAHVTAADEVDEAEVEAAVELIGKLSTSRAIFDEIRDGRAAAEEELVARALAGELDAYELEAVETPEGADELAKILAS